MDLVPYIFHEKQEGNLCAQHCLNALLQGPYFTAIDLAELATQLDQQEQDALGNSGPGSGKVTSQNMDDSGFFSVQVLSQALSIWNIQIIPWGAKEVADAKAQPEREAAFICNLEQHWYTLRRFGPSTQRWYDLNSMHPRPKYMSTTYLGMSLQQLEAEGYSIFVVRPLNKIEKTSTAETLSHSPLSTPKASVPSPVPAAPSPVATPAATPTFLSERQEMERIRQHRLEERKRALQPPSEKSTTTTTTATAAASETSKRTRVDRDGEETLKSNLLVTTPSFLPRCEVDTMAATLPMDNIQASENAPAKETFSGAGYRLGGDPAPPASSSSSSFSGVGFDQGDYADFGDDGGEDEEMQRAIAMSLQGSKQ